MFADIKKLICNRKAAAWAVVIVVAAAPAVVASIMQRFSVQGPVLVVYGPNIMELGSGKEGDVLTGTIVLHNRGNAPLVYRLRTGCACAKLTPASGEIAPQDSLEISLGLRLRTEGRD